MTPIRWTGTENTGRPGCWRVGISETLAARRERNLLVAEVNIARRQADRYRDHGTEIRLIRALDALRRFDEQNDPGDTRPAA